MPASEQTIVKPLTELVAADSVSSPDPSWDSSNRRVIRHLSNYAERDGWAVNIQELESTADAVNFATEAPFLESLGLETIVMGPGSIDVAHQPNEYMPIDQIQPAIDILRSLMNRYCM